MASSNRSALINRTLRVLKKHYKPVPLAKDRTLFEHLVFSALLENSTHEPAEQVFQTLRDGYFDWNEVRVSTVRELAEQLKPLVDPLEAAARLKQSLHSVFESVYQFDLEGMKKQNIGQAAKQIQKYNGTTPFMVAYVTQASLGGHSIPVNRGLLKSMYVIGVISQDEASKGLVPGLERVVSKSKGPEMGSILHQLGVEVGRNPYGQATRSLLLEIAPDCKDRLPKRATRKGKPSEQPAATSPAQEPPPAPAKKVAASTKGATTGKKKAAAKPKAKKPPTKKPAQAKKKDKPRSKTTGKKKATSRKLTKRKPR